VYTTAVGTAHTTAATTTIPRIIEHGVFMVLSWALWDECGEDTGADPQIGPCVEEDLRGEFFEA
jgi:hypothetical protein